MKNKQSHDYLKWNKIIFSSISYNDFLKFFLQYPAFQPFLLISSFQNKDISKQVCQQNKNQVLLLKGMVQRFYVNLKATKEPLLIHIILSKNILLHKILSIHIYYSYSNNKKSTSCFNIFAGKKKTSDYLFIRIRVLFTNFVFLFLRCISKPSFRIIKFVFTVSTSIFWCPSPSNRNFFTFTFRTNFQKILTHLKKFIMRLFNISIFFYQNSISDFDISNILIPFKEIYIGGFQ